MWYSGWSDRLGFRKPGSACLPGHGKSQGVWVAVRVTVMSSNFMAYKIFIEENWPIQLTVHEILHSKLFCSIWCGMCSGSSSSCLDVWQNIRFIFLMILLFLNYLPVTWNLTNGLFEWFYRSLSRPQFNQALLSLCWWQIRQSSQMPCFVSTQ